MSRGVLGSLRIIIHPIPKQNVVYSFRNVQTIISLPRTKQQIKLMSSANTNPTMIPNRYVAANGGGGGDDNNDNEDDDIAIKTAVGQSQQQQQQQQQGGELVVDNPCWGNPWQCDLSHLLSLDICKRKNTIIYESPNYIVLNKPPDLRMDGNYPATVHKLLTYWYPSPSLLGSLKKITTDPSSKQQQQEEETSSLSIRQEEEEEDKNTTTVLQSSLSSFSLSLPSQLELLKSISKLHKHNHLPDNELRPVHQLDYATSGVLCIARTTQAASIATVIFEERTATKTYVAVVEGHIPDISNSKHGNDDDDDNHDDHDNHCSWPILSQSHIDSFLNMTENQYRRSKGKSEKKQITFLGFQPPHAIFGKFKSIQKQSPRKQQQEEEGQSSTVVKTPKKQYYSSKKRKRPSLLSEKDWSDIWISVQHIPPSKLMNRTWKQLCQDAPQYKVDFEQATKRHNDILRSKLVQQQQKEEEEDDNEESSPSSLPTICRVLETENESNKGTTTTTTSLYIYAPLGQVSNEFGMKVPSSVVEELAMNHKDTTTQQALPNASLSSLLGGGVDLDYKPSLTKCTILARAYYHGRPITKVQLYPKTGRRHQLRVHLALLGHPILGDVTYTPKTTTDTATTATTTRQNNETTKQGNGSNDTSVMGEENTTSLPHRMCLHAQSLELPLETTVLQNEEPNPWKVIAPDPFLVSDDGELDIVS